MKKIDDFKGFLLGIQKRLKNLSIYFLAALVPMVISLILNPFISLNMDKEDFAITGYYSSFNLLILPLTGFSLIQFFSKSYFNFDVDKRQKLMNTVQTATLVFGSISLCIVICIYYFYQSINHISIPFFPFAILSFTYVFLCIFYTTLLTKLKFERKVNKYFKVSLFNSLLHAAMIIMFVIILKYRAYGYLWANFIGALIISLYSLSKSVTKFELDKSILKDMFFFCWPLVLANLMEYVFTGLDRSFLVRLNNAQELGLYNVAISIGTYVMAFYNAISQTFQPDIFESVSRKNAKSTVRTVLKMFFLNFVPIMVFILLAPFLIDILTYGRYVEATPFARIIALKGIFAGLYFSLSSIIIAGGLSKITLLNKTIGTVAVYFLTSYLIGHYSYIGAAWSQATSYFIMVVITLVFIFYKRKELFA